jgi:hypothetical protein
MAYLLKTFVPSPTFNRKEYTNVAVSSSAIQNPKSFHIRPVEMPRRKQQGIHGCKTGPTCLAVKDFSSLMDATTEIGLTRCGIMETGKWLPKIVVDTVVISLTSCFK